jgi:outer membrane cobalamin receptor
MSEFHAHSPLGKALPFVGALLVVACATKTFPIPGDEQERGEVITAEDIGRTGATTAWEVLERLVKFAVFTRTPRGEPDRIRRRGASTIVLHEDMRVYVDGIRILDVRELDHLPAGVISRIEVLSGLDGTTRYGTGAGDGVILIFTRG